MLRPAGVSAAARQIAHDLLGKQAAAGLPRAWARCASASPPDPDPPGSSSPPDPDPPDSPPPAGAHWLDRFPQARDWLEDANRRWWMDGLVASRCRQHHQLSGREAELRAALERQYGLLMARHGPLAAAAADSRTRTHVQVACLALATHAALLPWLRDEREVLEIVRAHMGAQTAPLLRCAARPRMQEGIGECAACTQGRPALVACRFLMRVAGWVQRDSYATLAGRLRGLQHDYGPSFETTLAHGAAECSLTVTSCFYHRLFEVEGQPQLLACCCCSQDRVWLEGGGLPRRGARAALVASRAQGDTRCCFSVRREPG
jgi:hypothetical protein